MKFIDKNSKVAKFQAGGVAPAPVPAEQAAPQGGDPMEQLIMAAVQALETQDPNLAMQVCQMLVELAQGSPAQPEVGAAPAGQAIFAKGGKLLRRVK